MTTVEVIETVTLTGDVASVEFGSLGSYEHLQLRMNIASDSTYASGVYRDYCLLYFNTSTATTNSDYSDHVMLARASSPNVYRAAGAHYLTVPFCSGTSLGASNFGTAVVDIFDYRNGSKNTTTSSPTGSIGPGTGSSEVGVGFSSGLWDAVTAVDKILLIPDLGSNWRSGSTFALYGWKST